MTGPPRELTRSERATIRRLVTGLCANYDEREKLCLPLDCPCYMLHKWWTGGLCRYFERSVLPVEPALEAVLTGNDTSQRQKNARYAGSCIFPPPARRIALTPAGSGPDGTRIKSVSAGFASTRDDMSAT